MNKYEFNKLKGKPLLDKNKFPILFQNNLKFISFDVYFKKYFKKDSDIIEDFPQIDIKTESFKKTKKKNCYTDWGKIALKKYKEIIKVNGSADMGKLIRKVNFAGKSY